MAKKKDKETQDAVGFDVEESIIQKFGEVFVKAQTLKENKSKVIRTTPRLDIILGGGIPEGSFVVITGPPKLGKSALSLQFAGNAQKVPSKYGDRMVFYFDIEGRIKERDLFSNDNLDTSPERFKLIKSSEEKILTGEDFIAIAEHVIDTVPGAIIILDSLSDLCTEERQEADIKNRFRDNTQALLAMFCRRIAQKIPVRKTIVIGITHRMANQGNGMSKWTEASGTKIQYRADVKLKGTHFSDWEVSTQRVGQDVHWECETSALVGPGKKATCKFRYAYGYDEEAELVDIAVELGLLKKSGAWISNLDTENPIKLQGFEKWTTYLRENPEEYKKLYNIIFTEYFPFQNEVSLSE